MSVRLLLLATLIQLKEMGYSMNSDTNKRSLGSRRSKISGFYKVANLAQASSELTVSIQYFRAQLAPATSYELIKLFTTNEYNIIKNIKEFSYLYISINILDNIFIRELLIYLLEDYTIINKKKTELVYFISKMEYDFIKSYYKMIYIERLLLGIYIIIRT